VITARLTIVKTVLIVISQGLAWPGEARIGLARRGKAGILMTNDFQRHGAAVTAADYPHVIRA
jgi:hypothetical protein